MSVLFQKNATTTQRPGSTVKLMCALIVNDYLSPEDLDDTVTVSSDDTVDWGSNTNAGLIAGDVLSYRDLLYGAMLPSGNDAAKCLARNVGALIPGGGSATSKFVSAMNAKASALGMATAVFTDAYGVDIGNTMSARDLAALMRAYAQVPFLVTVAGTYQRVATITGPNARTPTWTHTINPDGTVKLPEFICGKTGTVTYGGDPSQNSGACIAVLWRLPGGGLRVTGILNAASDLDRFKDLRRLMDFEIARTTAY